MVSSKGLNSICKSINERLVFLLQEFGFIPQTFVLPQDVRNFKRVWEEGGNRQKWILKPVGYVETLLIKFIFYLIVLMALLKVGCWALIFIIRASKYCFFLQSEAMR